MTDFRKKNKYRRWLYAPATLTALFILTAIVFRAAWHSYQKLQEAKTGISELQTQISAETERQQFLQSEVSKLGTPRGVEQELRESFGVVKPGEKMLII